MNTQSNSNAGSGCPDTACSPSYSDTPETDAEAFVATYDYWESVDVVRISFAERLERERNEARDMLRKAVANLSHGYECPGALRPNDCRCGYMGLLYAAEKLSSDNVKRHAPMTGSAADKQDKEVLS